MKINPNMLIPPAVLLGGVGYTLWPHLEGVEAPAAAEKPAEDGLPMDLIKLVLGDPPLRNPFMKGGAVPSTELTTKDTAASKEEEKVEDEELAKAEANKPDPETEGLALTSIMIGPRSAAIINGKKYLLGDFLEKLENDGHRWQLHRITAHGVILVDAKRSKPLALTFAPPKSKDKDKAISADGFPGFDGNGLPTLPPSIPPEVATLLGKFAGVDLGALQGQVSGGTPGRGAGGNPVAGGMGGMDPTALIGLLGAISNPGANMNPPSKPVSSKKGQR